MKGAFEASARSPGAALKLRVAQAAFSERAPWVVCAGVESVSCVTSFVWLDGRGLDGWGVLVSLFCLVAVVLEEILGAPAVSLA